MRTKKRTAFLAVLTIGVLVALLSVKCVKCVDPYEGKKYFLSGVPTLTGGLRWGTFAENEMTRGQDNIWRKTCKRIAPGRYNYKVNDGHDHWWGKPNGDNMVVDVSEACDVDICFNPADSSVWAEGVGLGELKYQITELYVPCTFDNMQWEFSELSRMDSVGDMKFRIVFKDQEAGSYQFKFASDAQWTENWGCEDVCYAGDTLSASYDGFNIDVNLSKRSDVEIYADLSDYESEAHAGGRFVVNVKEIN